MWGWEYVVAKKTIEQINCDTMKMFHNLKLRNKEVTFISSEELKYAEKRRHYKYTSMQARTQLSVMDHNYNVGREHASTLDGKTMKQHFGNTDCESKILCPEILFCKYKTVIQYFLCYQ